MSAILIRHRESGEVVRRMDTTGRTEREIERIERGLLVQIGFEHYGWETVSDDDAHSDGDR